jgi:flagellin
MAQVINTNTLSLNAQRNLNRNTTDLGVTIQRLSSGLRINSAKDDAAGLAIATRMSVQVSGLGVAIRNANDGISISQTAEGAMDELTRALTRANDLALQAASYNTDVDRNSLNQEVTQIIDELSRVVNQTRFNGQKLLAGGFSADVQLGTSINETVNVSVGNLSPTVLGVASSYQSVSALNDADLADRIRNAQDNVITGGTSTINGIPLAATPPNANSAQKIAAINAGTGSSGVTAFSFGNAAVATNNVSDANATGAGQNIGNNALVINGVSINGNGAGTDLADLVANINSAAAQTGVTAVLDVGAAGDQNRLVLVNRSGTAISVTVNNAETALVTGFAAGTTTVDAGANGAIILNQEINSTSVNFDGGGTTDTAITGTVAGGDTFTLANAPVNAMRITDTASANLALLSFQAAIDQVSGERAVLGAKMNRFESTIRNLENVRENISAARSRIQDADFAVETANLTRTQILQQAGTAMVAQANQLPQGVLSLLQG